MTAIRRALARWLYPQAFDSEQAYLRMKSEAADAYHWLGEHRDAQAALRWLLDNDKNRRRAIGEPAIGTLPSDISAFRDLLDRRNLGSAR